MTDGQPKEKVVVSIHSRNGMYCVDVVVTPGGFALQICRRDEERWQVIRRTGEHLDREEAVARAREIVATFE